MQIMYRGHIDFKELFLLKEAQCRIQSVHGILTVGLNIGLAMTSYMTIPVYKLETIKVLKFIELL